MGGSFVGDPFPFPRKVAWPFLKLHPFHFPCTVAALIIGTLATKKWAGGMVPGPLGPTQAEMLDVPGGATKRQPILMQCLQRRM